MGALVASLADLGYPETVGAVLARAGRVAVDRLRAAADTRAGEGARFRDPALIFRDAGLEPDPWQAEYVRSSARQNLVLCSRQVGKSTAAAVRAWKRARYHERSLTLIVSPSLRQSQETFRKVQEVRAASSAMACTVMESERESALQLELSNGSRIVALPGKERTIVGYSGVSLLILDEAARIPDATYNAVRPMLSISRGDLDVLSTPLGKRGFFWREWDAEEKRRNGGQPASWRRWRVTATECPRHGAEFLASELESLGDAWYRQEYFCEFLDVLGAAFAPEAILAAMDDELQGLALDLWQELRPAGMVAEELRGLRL